MKTRSRKALGPASISGSLNAATTGAGIVAAARYAIDREVARAPRWTAAKTAWQCGGNFDPERSRRAHPGSVCGTFTGRRRPTSRCDARWGGEDGASRLRRRLARRPRATQPAGPGGTIGASPPSRACTGPIGPPGRGRPPQWCCRSRRPAEHSGDQLAGWRRALHPGARGGFYLAGEGPSSEGRGWPQSALRGSRAPAPLPTTVSNAGRKPAGNKLGLRLETRSGRVMTAAGRGRQQ